MTYLLWGLLNIGLFLFFILICFKATKLIREKLGLFASIIFVFGLLSYVGHSNGDNDNKEPNSNQIKTWKFVSEDSLKSNDTYLIDIDLEKTLISKYYLGIKYSKDKEGQVNIPISAYSSTTGYVSGTNWKPLSIIVNTTNDNNKFEYFVHGVVEWKLLGATIYSELKEYKGVAFTE
ncbi:hypothetical protein [Flavobacterium agrisoli]|uniref:Uncharacterized protein n=1 Tax=Flavobacterium agrisoli TaxID=2793066 RepID=A0A934PK10_9FLAO|nr:hypothetical protein [Flavobacterium agrisoli]MBK0368740.1 hypothetical protein [Flavobacterium agrisoli]